jgi:large subunit ribosomal protein L25
MSNKHTLSIEPRLIVGRKVKSLRRTGLTPANIFGKTADSANVQINTKLFEKLFAQTGVFAQTGESTLIYLQTAGQPDRPVLVREVTKHPVTGQLLHVDFNQVNLKEKVIAPVEIELIDEAPAEKEKLGILVQQLDSVEVEALPADMPEKLEVSLSGLVEVSSAILVKDIVVDPRKVEIKSDPEMIVAKIEALAAEEPKEVPVAEGEPVADGEDATEASIEPGEQQNEEKSE